MYEGSEGENSSSETLMGGFECSAVADLLSSFVNSY